VVVIVVILVLVIVLLLLGFGIVWVMFARFLGMHNNDMRRRH